MPRKRRRRKGQDTETCLAYGCLALLGLIAVAIIINYATENPGQVAIVAVLCVVVALRRFWPATSTASSANVLEIRAPLEIDELLLMSPSEFEAYVGSLLTKLDYRDVNVRGGAGDLGADILGLDQDGRTVAIQCKRYSPGRNVGSPEIQAFMGMQQRQHRTDVGIFVTTSGFTRPAQNLALAHGIMLIDGADILELQRRALRPKSRQPDLSHNLGKRSAGLISRAWDTMRRV